MGYFIECYPWWRHQMQTFSALLAICVGNSPVPVNSPHKCQWLGALMFSLTGVWINGWLNNGQAGDLRRYRAHYDVTVMHCEKIKTSITKTPTHRQPTNISHSLCIWAHLLTRFNFNLNMDTNHMPSKVCDKITYPFSNFNGTAVKVWE